MKMIRVILIAVVITLANAQQLPPQPGADDLTAVAPQMRAIVNALRGAWSIAWIDDNGRTIGKGEETWMIAPGGSAFIEDNRSVVNEKPADDYAVMWWDGKAQKVRGIWCQAAINDEGCSGFDVALDGGKVVLTGEWEYRGKRQAWREVFEVTGMTLIQTLHIGEPGKEMRLSGTIRGTKSGSSPLR